MPEEIEYLCRRCEHSKTTHHEVDYGPIGLEWECGLCSCHTYDPEDNLDYLLRVGKRKAFAMKQAEAKGWAPREVCFCHHGKEWHEKGKCWYLDCPC